MAISGWVSTHPNGIPPEKTPTLRETEPVDGLFAALQLHIDLADLRGYHYQNGAIFSVFTAGEPTAVGNGGRYDGIGKSFGRARPATGFTLDLRQLADVLTRGGRAGSL